MEKDYKFSKQQNLMMYYGIINMSLLKKRSAGEAFMDCFMFLF